MNSTKKTLTTLSAAAALALGGIAIAQTSGYGTDSNQAGASLGSSSTAENTGDTSLNNSGTTMGGSPSDSSTLSNSASADTTTSSDLGASPIAQMDRN
jgi:hypothetical protein